MSLISIPVPSNSALSTNFSAAIKPKERYIQLCATDNTVPVFMQPWWLDAVCKKGSWDTCLSEDNDGNINGALVYYKVKLRGILIAIVMPELTPNAGIWLKLKDKDKLKKHSLYTDTKKITETLIAQIPHVPLYHQKFNYALTDWQPFFWEGYNGEVHYSYTLDMSDTEKIYADMKGSVRTAIKKAEKIVTVEHCESLNEFYMLCRKSLEKQGAKSHFLLGTLVSLDAILKQRNLRKIYLARDAAGNAHGAVYIMFDENNKSAHYLIGGSDPVLRQSGAVMLLLWHAILDAAENGYTLFDFEGSMIPNVENAFRNFGAVQMPFFRITKARNKFLELLTLFFPDYR